MAEIIDGRKIAAEIREEIKERVAKLKDKGVAPGLAAIIVGEDPASLSYLRSIARGCEKAGMLMETVELPENITQEELESKIEELNKNPKFHGIILQLPLPKHLNTLKAESAISPDKDVDGTNPVNTGKLLLGEETLLPSTPYGVRSCWFAADIAPKESTWLSAVGATLWANP